MPQVDEGGPPAVPATGWKLVAEMLGDGYEVRLPVAGRSMWPSLKAGDTVRLRQVELAAIGVGDVVLWRRPGAPPVLHRVVARGDGSIRTRGDALECSDGFVAAEHVLGKVVAVEGTSGSIRAVMSTALVAVGRARSVLGRLRRVLGSARLQP